MNLEVEAESAFECPVLLCLPLTPSSSSFPCYFHCILKSTFANMPAFRLPTRALAPSSFRSSIASRPVLLAPAALRKSYASSASPNGFPQLPPGFEKLAHSPTALSAISNLVEVMKQNGVDLHTGEKPSMWQMIKLAKNQEVRDATTKGKFERTLLRYVSRTNTYIVSSMWVYVSRSDGGAQECGSGRLAAAPTRNHEQLEGHLWQRR